MSEYCRLLGETKETENCLENGNRVIVSKHYDHKGVIYKEEYVEYDGDKQIKSEVKHYDLNGNEVSTFEETGMLIFI